MTRHYQLDQEQLAVINSNEKNIIVVAASGSGKTLVLTERVSKLLNDGVPPHNIVCITFTNMAASEMRERLKDVPGIADAFIGTIHSFANRVYKESGISYRIRTTEIELDIYRELLSNRRGYVGKYRNLVYERLLAYLDMKQLHEADRVSYEMVRSFLTPSEAEDYRWATNDVNRLCKERNILSFDMLLKVTRDYFHRIGASLEYLLVDEYQDVGKNEASFIDGLESEHNFLVGDPRQAIYGFKGGDVNIFLRKMKDPEYTTYMLNNNYRSAKKIIDEASIVISQAMDEMGSGVVVKSDKVGSVIHGSKYNVRDYLLKIKNEESYKDWFILTRSNQQIMELSRILKEMRIPHTSFKRQGMSRKDLDKIMNDDTVKLLTVHVSKGLENKNVLLYGNFPLSVPTYRLNKDERKVMYVGMTRAKENLIVLS